MRITIVLAILTISLAVLGPCNLVFAQNSSSAAELDNLPGLNEAGAVELGSSLIYPGSPLYFLKAIREKIELLTSSSAEAKMQRELEFAQRRLREVNAMVKSKKQDLIDETLERYKDHLAKASEIALNNDELNFKIGEASSRHLDVLQRVYDQVGNPRAKQAILAAIERIQEQNKTLLQKLNLESQQKLIRTSALRQALACKLLIREATSSGLTDTEKVALQEEVKKCRQNARENLKDELMEIKQKRMQF